MRLVELESKAEDLWTLHEMIERSRRAKQDGAHQISLGLTGWRCIARYHSSDDSVTLSEVCTFDRPPLTDRDSLKAAMTYDAKAVVEWLEQEGYDSKKLLKHWHRGTEVNRI